MKNLLIIGNGFDIAHGFKTRYSCFKEWIENLLDDPSPTDALPLGYFITDRDYEANYKTGLCFLKELFDNNISLDYRWNTFEDSLAKLPIASKFESIVSEVFEPGEAFENPSQLTNFIEAKGLIAAFKEFLQPKPKSVIKTLRDNQEKLKARDEQSRRVKPDIKKKRSSVR